MKLRPSGLAKEIIQAAGLQATYSYDDLIFIENNPFIIQFNDENPKNLKLFFNVDCEVDVAEKLEKQLNNAATEREFTITKSGEFEMKEKKGSEETEIKFLPF